MFLHWYVRLCNIIQREAKRTTNEHMLFLADVTSCYLTILQIRISILSTEKTDWMKLENKRNKLSSMLARMLERETTDTMLDKRFPSLT